ncbi:flagellar basal body protein [Roseobacter sp. HKCCA0434]|uniref:flagellar basal body protein n=1 Tax=Roseobacter sp. HKCCA0434 TaxID=3079297 RepID=UPI002905D9B5|nr:flagellar basal body protein [Roseobacter sp. HKCCA0434]
MSDSNSILFHAANAARHASARQAVLSRNIAHADTPGYIARDLEPFRALVDGVMSAHATRAGHVGAGGDRTGWRSLALTQAQLGSANGNTVDLEDQMIRAADTRRQHDMAMTLYSKSMDILRLGLGRAR